MLFRLAKPKLVRKPENVTATLSEDVMLTCKMDGDPPPVITWRKKWSPQGASAKLPVGRASQLEGRGLRIERVTAADEGEYECSGKNPAGAAEASAYLTVYSPPVFTVQPKDRTVEEGALLNVECDALGNPTPTKFWSREGNQVSEKEWDFCSLLTGCFLGSSFSWSVIAGSPHGSNVEWDLTNLQRGFVGRRLLRLLGTEQYRLQLIQDVFEGDRWYRFAKAASAIDRPRASQPNVA